MGAAGYHIISEKSVEETLGNDGQTVQHDSKRNFTMESMQSIKDVKLNVDRSDSTNNVGKSQANDGPSPTSTAGDKTPVSTIQNAPP